MQPTNRTDAWAPDLANHREHHNCRGRQDGSSTIHVTSRRANVAERRRAQCNNDSPRNEVRLELHEPYTLEPCHTHDHACVRLRSNIIIRFDIVCIYILSINIRHRWRDIISSYAIHPRMRGCEGRRKIREHREHTNGGYAHLPSRLSIVTSTSSSPFFNVVNIVVVCHSPTSHGPRSGIVFHNVETVFVGHAPH